MTNTKKILAILCLVGFFALQVQHTVSNTVHWPLMPINLFFKRCSYDCSYLYVNLIEDTGTQQLVQARQCLPLESFRLQGIVKDRLLRREDNTQQRAFSQLLLDTLNGPSWMAFDEIYPAAQPQTGQRFVGFDVQRHHYALADYPPGTELQAAAVETVYRYREAQFTRAGMG